MITPLRDNDGMLTGFLGVIEDIRGARKSSA